MVQTKAGGATTRLTVGRHGIITAEEARRRAALTIARIKAGEEPVPEPMAKLAGGPTVGELAARYLEEHVAVHCKPATAAIYDLAINKYIVPAFGKAPILALGREQVTGMHYKLRDTPYMANMAIRCLSRMFNKAADWGLVPEGSNNPCRFVVMYKEPPRERFSDRGGVPPPGAGVERGGSRRRHSGAGRGGAPAADADRVPARRDPDAALGGGGPGGRRASARRQQDGRADDSAVAGGGEGARGPAAGCGQSLGRSRDRRGHAT